MKMKLISQHLHTTASMKMHIMKKMKMKNTPDQLCLVCKK